MSNVVSIAPEIRVKRDIFGSRCYVEILPRRVDRPTQFFRNAPAALRYAEELAKEQGWPIEDQTGGDT